MATTAVRFRPKEKFVNNVRETRLGHRNGSSWLRATLSVVAIAFCVTGLVSACRSASRPNVDIVSISSISGAINGMPIEATVSATFNTGRGGRSTCEFSKLPSGFTPGTLSTHT